MGLVYQRQDKNKEAIDAYEYCIAIDDHNTMGHLGKGNCLMELGDYTEAIKSLKSSLDNDETDAEVLCNIAECYENLKDDNAAKYHFQKSLKINPNLSDAYFGIACIYKRNNQWKDAERNLLKAIDIDRYEVIYLIELAEIFLIQENKEKCYQYYAQAQQIDHDTIEILLDYAHAKFELGDLEDAVQLLMDNIENHDKDSRIFYRIASYIFTLGEFEKGYNFLHAGLKLNPKEYILLYEFAPFLENNQNITNIIDIYIN
jgi:tetratricopeptide (TPR) repeat protein